MRSSTSQISFSIGTCRLLRRPPVRQRRSRKRAVFRCCVANCSGVRFFSDCEVVRCCKVPAPSVEDAPGILDAGKPVFVEALIAELAIEALDVRVLGRFSGSDEVDTLSVLVGSLVEGLACELGPVVYQQGLGFAMV